MKIVVVDYGLGNVRSIINALNSSDCEVILSRNKSTLISADGIILPGVGSFPRAMKNLEDYNLIDILRDYALSDKPILGICLGMQVLFEESDEFENTKGLGIISGKVKLMPSSNLAKIPHIGWSFINRAGISWEESIFKNIDEESFMYFVHSYSAFPSDKHLLSKTVYGDNIFCSSVKKGNTYGCQFHPEKSGPSGIKILENFVNICRDLKN